MKVSPNGIKFIAEHEGEILEVYKDPVGLPTLGVGHLLSKAELAAMPVGTKITRQQSREYLAKDLARFERAIESAITVPVNQNQFDALVSFAFNIGESAFRRSSTLRKLNAKDYVGAADAMLAWNKATKNGKRVVLTGLTRRRKEERALFLSPSAAPSASNPDQHIAEPTPSGNHPTVEGSPDFTEGERPGTNIENIENAKIEAPKPASQGGPVTVKTERTSIWTKIALGIAAITGMGINVGNFVNNKLNEMSGQHLAYALGGVALIALALWLYDRAQSRAQEKTMAKIDTASDPQKNTVELDR